MIGGKQVEYDEAITDRTLFVGDVGRVENYRLRLHDDELYYAVGFYQKVGILENGANINK